MPDLNMHQMFGIIVVAAGLYATLCGFGVLSPPPNTRAPNLSVVHFLWIGPLAILIGVLEIFGTR